AVVEAAGGGRVVPATDAAPHLDRVVGLVEPHTGDLDSIIEERPGGAERALAPSLLQGFVTADQHDATRHRAPLIPRSDWFRGTTHGEDPRGERAGRDDGLRVGGGARANPTAHWASCVDDS